MVTKDWFQWFMTQPCRVVVGSLGTGKSTFMTHCADEAVKRGWRVSILNPSYEESDLAQVGQDIQAFTEEAMRRLKNRGLIQTYDPLHDEQHWMLCCDEMPNWSDRIDAKVMSVFFDVCTQFLRLANMSVLLVGNRNGLHYPSGLYGRVNAFQSQVVVLKLQSVVSPRTAIISGSTQFRTKQKINLPEIQESVLARA